MDELTQKLRAVLGRDAVLTEADELLVYECDGLTQHKQRPRAVVFPQSTEEVAEVLRLLTRERVPFAPRGAGTGLSGGALTESVVIELARMRRLLELDTENLRAVVETGLVNAQLSRAAAPFKLHYVPDPSSQMTCTIGGNIAENAGGIHCLKYGMTVDHVAAARVVLASGEVVDLRAGGSVAPGYDLLGVFVGSEGTFGIATEATLILTPLAPAVRTLLADFADVNDGSRAVSAIIAAGLMPSALEMMDGATIRAVEQSVFAAGLPPEAEAALLIELDGLEAGLDEEAARVESICREHKARHVRLAQDERERKKFWAARKGAFGAMGRLAPDLMLQDAVVPRSRLPEVLAATYRTGAKHNLLVANVFHAGDGNLHPYICYDARQPEEVKRVKEASREMMEICVRAGGTITGEHGVGLDKSEYLPLIFSPDDMDAMLRVRAAFDPGGLCNPGKIIPTARSCGEARGAATRRRGDAETREGGDKATLSSSLNNDDDEAREATNEAREAANEPREAIDDEQRFAASPRLRVPASQSPASQSPALLSEPSPQPPIVFARSVFQIEAAHEALSRIVGAEHVNVSPQLNIAASPRPRVSASCLSVSPANQEEACEVLRLATHEGWAVVPAGAGTWLDVGHASLRADLILQTGRMRRIIEHEPADLVATAEAGVALADFNSELNGAGQWLPLDPPDDGRASLGGVAATGMIGAQSLGYGAPRSFVIGMRVALADGHIIKAGGRVVKNVAGYDLCKLFVGSYGSLCLILELTFKLRPLPAQSSTVIACGPLSSLRRAASSLRNAQLFPVALELLSPRAAACIRAPLQTERDAALMIRFAGAAEAVAFQVEQARVLLDGEPGIKQTTVSSGDEMLWRSLAALLLQESAQLSWRVHAPPAKLDAMLAEAEEDERAAPFAFASWWHAGAGDGRLRVTSALPEELGAAVWMLTRWRERARRAGGCLMIESAPREIKEAFDVWDDMGASATVMQRIKQQLDSSNTFSPGRFDFGRHNAAES
ncbi:MAG: glycolate oxidase [Blastocatellia bacterium]|nr:glycolate oxidase [Blastocatellia bacterium]